MTEKEIRTDAENVNRAEIEKSRDCVDITMEIIDKLVMLAKEINQKLCSRELDPSDKRITRAVTAEGLIEDAIGSLSMVIGYETATIAIDRISIEEDE